MKLKFFHLAKVISRSSDHPQHPMGAVIARGNKLVSIGHNKNKTHPKASKHPFQRIHAELSAILNSREDLRGCDIYVYRETRNGTTGMAKPCIACESLIREVGISRVYYSDIDGFKEEIYG